MYTTSFTAPVKPSYNRGRHQHQRQCTRFSACRTTPPKRKGKVTFKLFCQRIASVQDKKWVHKLSGSVCVLSTAGVVLSAPFMRYTTGNFQLPPTSVIVPLVVAWAASVSILSVSGTVLAIRHRHTQPAERNLFILSGFSNLISAYIAVSSLPIQHPLTDTVTRCILSACLVSACFIVDPKTVSRPSRRPPKPIASKCALNLIPIISGIPFLLLAASTRFLCDHPQYLAMIAMKPNFLPALLYGDVLNGLCAGLGAFTVTMKDRKLLSQSREHSIIAASSGVSLSLFVGFLFASL